MHWQDFSVFGDCDYLFEGGDVCEMCGISGSIIFCVSEKGITTQLKQLLWGFLFSYLQFLEVE